MWWDRRVEKGEGGGEAERVGHGWYKYDINAVMLALQSVLRS